MIFNILFPVSTLKLLIIYTSDGLYKVTGISIIYNIVCIWINTLIHVTY